MKLANMLIYGGSFLCFLRFLAVGDAPLVTMGTIPFFLLAAGGFHELGHCVGCLLTGSPVREVRLPLLRYAEGKITLSDNLSPVSYCAFQKGRGVWLVYLLGPAFSLALWGMSIWACRAYPSATAQVGCVLAAVIAAGNLIPFGRNDMVMILREILFRNEKRT